MTASSTVAAGRRAATRALLDTCTVTRGTPGTFDPGTGAYTESSTHVHTGPCRVTRSGLRETTAVGGEQQLRRPVLVLPHGSPTLTIGDTVAVTGSAAGTFTVVDRQPATTATADRYDVEEREP